MAIPTRLRKIFTSPLMVVNLFKKTQIDNFLGGLIVGAVISLLVNIVTVQIQEQIARQQYFEALEHEIVENYYEAHGTITSIDDLRKNNKPPSYFAFTKRYHTNIWDSGNALTYIYNLDPKIQNSLSEYYSVGIERSNRYLDHLNSAVDDLEQESTRCRELEKYTEECSDAEAAFSKSLEYYEELQLKEAQYVLKQTNALLDQFHPTKDRIHDPMLTLFMGTKASAIFILDPQYATSSAKNH